MRATLGACATGARAAKKVAVEVSQVLVFGPDGMSDENQLRVVECRSCPFRALSTFEESRRGSMDSDGSWHHDGWHVTPELFKRVKTQILACPSPRDKDCRCAAHSWMALGGWGVVTSLRKGGIELGEWFRLSDQPPERS